MKIELELDYCTQCPHGSVLPDPDPYDSFNYDDVKVVCKKENKKIAGALRPYEIGKYDTIPNWCPLKK